MDTERISRAVRGEVIKEIEDCGDEIRVRLESGRVLIFTGTYSRDVDMELKREVVELVDEDY